MLRGRAARGRAGAAGRAAGAERALVPLVPIALATGWSSLILFATRIPLNPMSATLGALVIAISTEFSVLLSERFRAERRAGLDPAQALARTYRFTGSAVLVSGITAIAGFGVLSLSSITMLRDFGLVTLIDLSVSLLGVLLVLPSVLALSERGGARQRLARAGCGGSPGAAARGAGAPRWRERRCGRVPGRSGAARPSAHSGRDRDTPLRLGGRRAGARARDRLPALHAQLAQAGARRACRPAGSCTSFAAPLAGLDVERRRQPEPTLHARAPRSAGAQRVPAGQARAARAGVLRDQLREVRARGRLDAGAGEAPGAAPRAVRRGGRERLARSHRQGGAQARLDDSRGLRRRRGGRAACTG